MLLLGACLLIYACTPVDCALPAGELVVQPADRVVKRGADQSQHTGARGHSAHSEAGRTQSRRFSPRASGGRSVWQCCASAVAPPETRRLLMSRGSPGAAGPPRCTSSCPARGHSCPASERSYDCRRSAGPAGRTRCRSPQACRHSRARRSQPRLCDRPGRIRGQLGRRTSETQHISRGYAAMLATAVAEARGRVRWVAAVSSRETGLP